MLLRGQAAVELIEEHHFLPPVAIKRMVIVRHRVAVWSIRILLFTDLVFPVPVGPKI